MLLTRRDLLMNGVAAAGFVVLARIPARVHAQLFGGKTLLGAASIEKWALPLVIPPAMPRTGKIRTKGGKQIDYYEIAVRQFEQQVLPSNFAKTTVWSYGVPTLPGTFNYPAFTIEAKWQAPVRVKWVNELTGPGGGHLPHLLPIDQTLHWANPGGGEDVDGHGMSQEPYTGPVPMVVHVHGAHTTDESDGYAEAWWLPAATDIPVGYETVGTWYQKFKAEFLAERPVGHPSDAWTPGSATFEYPNDQAAATLWYHDHTLGMTRANVYAGPAGFYVLRGGPQDMVTTKAGKPAVLPGPAPALGDPPGLTYYEIPLAIQDRSFYDDGSLFYPGNRAYFEGLNVPGEDPQFEGAGELDIPFHPDEACDGQESDVAPIWNPEFFGNTMLVNGRTWPSLDVEPRRYRFRVLNGCNSRFLILQLGGGDIPFWQIGAEGGFLAAPARLQRLLMSPAERADVIVDFAGLMPGAKLYLHNLGPDEPFGGGKPGQDFEPADPASTGVVMEFKVVPSRAGRDPSTRPEELVLPPLPPLPPATVTRQVSLNELDSETVFVKTQPDGSIVLACTDPEKEPFGPREALLGIMHEGMPVPVKWDQEITEAVAPGATEVWEIFNFTMDAHPIHLHEVQFRVVNREPLVLDGEGMAEMPAVGTGATRPPEPWETGPKDTVIAYPGEITRVQATFDLPGRYVWHCHIVEHEDNEMMRPYDIGPVTPPRPPKPLHH